MTSTTSIIRPKYIYVHFLNSADNDPMRQCTDNFDCWGKITEDNYDMTGMPECYKEQYIGKTFITFTNQSENEFPLFIKEPPEYLDSLLFPAGDKVLNDVLVGILPKEALTVK